MITLTRINGTNILINESFVEIVEETPDTVVTMQNGHKYLVKETVEEILYKISESHRELIKFIK